MERTGSDSSNVRNGGGVGEGQSPCGGFRYTVLHRTKDKVFSQSTRCRVFTSCGEPGTLRSFEESVCECVRWGTSSSSSSMSPAGVSHCSEVPGELTVAGPHRESITSVSSLTLWIPNW